MGTSHREVWALVPCVSHLSTALPCGTRPRTRCKSARGRYQVGSGLAMSRRRGDPTARSGAVIGCIYRSAIHLPFDRRRSLARRAGAFSWGATYTFGQRCLVDKSRTYPDLLAYAARPSRRASACEVMQRGDRYLFAMAPHPLAIVGAQPLEVLSSPPLQDLAAAFLATGALTIGAIVCPPTLAFLPLLGQPRLAVNDDQVSHDQCPMP